MPILSLEHWVDGLQSSGRYWFLRSEALKDSGLSAQAASKALQRAVKNGRLIRPKEYFCVIVPLEYRAAGAPPASWFVHDLMAAMGLPYYVGLLSAAALHGSSHQQPQVFQVLTNRSVRPITAGRAQLKFFASKYIAQAAVTEMKTPTGFMKVSTPETTAVDLVRFAKASGHLDHVALVIGDLAESLNPDRLLAAVRAVSDVPNAQRLGYVLDSLRRRKLSQPIHDWLERQDVRLQPLRTGQPAVDAQVDRRWRVWVKSPLEIEP